MPVKLWGWATRLGLVFGLVMLLELSSIAASVNTRSLTTRKAPSVSESQHARKRMRTLAKGHASRPRTQAARIRRRRNFERFYTSSFADSTTDGDITAGEDPIVRQSAIDALGNLNGTVVAIEPTSGRILAMVNQKLALSSGAQPCSTIKLSTALAGLSEGLIDKETEIRLGRRSRMNLTTALAHSNNPYFEAVGRKLGFDKISYYAHQFGLGELAGYQIEGEQLGEYPESEISSKLGGVGKMCSFGEGISMTPLQLGALVSSIANGGTLYYLQHPSTPEAVADFQPRVKRHLDIANVIPELSDGMAGAVQYGTARSLRLNFSEESILGKTGTCSHAGTRFGWFASYANTDIGRIVTVVFLQGGRPTYGPKAAEITGRMYRNLYDHNFFVARSISSNPEPTVEKVNATPPAQE
ncbi:MAG TPA: penicillin-binding transpeptidase domain-containing protein [Terriglobales bacterium]|jgi:penicillin-binding protein 2|nr:penicillin-binding transpeptidase domain-containing protein [Terriglobales bacterium]